MNKFIRNCPKNRLKVSLNLLPRTERFLIGLSDTISFIGMLTLLLGLLQVIYG